MLQGPRAFRNSSNPVFEGEEINVIVCEWTRRWNRRVDIPSDISVAKLYSRNKFRSLWNSAAWLMLPACSARCVTHLCSRKAPSRKKSRQFSREQFARGCVDGEDERGSRLGTPPDTHERTHLMIITNPAGVGFPNDTNLHPKADAEWRRTVFTYRWKLDLSSRHERRLFFYFCFAGANSKESSSCRLLNCL